MHQVQQPKPRATMMTVIYERNGVRVEIARSMQPDTLFVARVRDGDHGVRGEVHFNGGPDTREHVVSALTRLN